MNKFFGLCFLLGSVIAYSQTYYVATDGNDSHNGTINRPFKTIQKALNILKPGDSCFIRGGIYHERLLLNRSGTPKRPITIQSYPNEKVVLDGREALKSRWIQIEENIYKTNIGKNIKLSQLFKGDSPMVEARYPNLNQNQPWSSSNWASAETNSQEGFLFHEELKHIETDWTQTHLVINGAHQFMTWSRPVISVDKKQGSLSYNFGVKLSTMNPKSWDDDRFYLFGSKGLLDTFDEWVYEPNTGELTVFTNQINLEKIKIKVIDYALKGEQVSHVNIKGLHFFACTFQFKRCRHIKVSEMALKYPTYTRLLTDSYPKASKASIVETEFSGDHNTLDAIVLSYSNTTGIVVQGTNNVIKNSLIHDVNTTGALNYAGIRLWDQSDEYNGNNQIINCEMHHMGQSAIYFRGPNNLIKGNHIHHVGLASKDQAAIQTVNPSNKGSRIEKNFIHHCTEKGIRADYQSRGLTISKNIIWQCGMGMITKGEDHVVSNNYIIGDGTSGLLLIPTRPEPYKWWATVPQLKEQNARSLFKNNCIGKLAFRKKAITDAYRLNNNTLLSADKTINMERACNTYQQSIPKLLVALKQYNY